MTPVYDVIVVGAGPGGSNAAAVALGHGLSVAQVERCTFPRTKPCAGGLTVKSCDALRLDLDHVVRTEVHEVEFNVWQARVNRFVTRRSFLVKMVLRPEFDNWLVTQNLKADRFEFYDGQRVTDISFDDVFRVATPTMTLLGKHLVGADGAYSTVNRLFDIARPKGQAVAVEVTLSTDSIHAPNRSGPCWDFGAIPDGYGWVFPKDDHWSVGLYTLKGKRDLRERLREYVVAKGITTEPDPLETFESHLYPYGGYRPAVPSCPVYLVGDAGAFGDGLMGEGIYYALESGRIAGDTIAESLQGRGDHRTYYRRLRRSVLADTFITYQITKEFYRDVDKAVTILENPLVWRPLVQGYTDGATVWEIVKKGGWFLTKSLVLSSLHVRREGASLPLSLRGCFRGLPYLAEAFFRRLLRFLRLMKQ